ncbi:MAG: sigma-70 family RNA polymerase sigma factor [Clostridium celatum]|nr:sigma-70 family RNA polymerase sigma factor [Clostridium celatum]
MIGTLTINNNIISNLDESKLIKKAIKGDKNSFVHVFKKYKLYLYKIAYMYVKDEEKALEILQETIVKGVFNIHKLKNPDYFKTWITRVLINVAIDINKKNSKLEQLNELHDVIQSKDSISVEEKIDLYNAVDLLKQNYKTVIIMKYFNDMKIKDIADVMDIPESTVKTYLTRAKAALKNTLKEGYLNE